MTQPRFRLSKTFAQLRNEIQGIPDSLLVMHITKQHMIAEFDLQLVEEVDRIARYTALRSR